MNAPITSNDVITGAAQTRLRTIIERIERLEEDKAVIATDIKEVYAEAKGEGFDVKILRKVVTIRKKDAAKRQEEEAILDLYMAAIGMISSYQPDLADNLRSRKPGPAHAAEPTERMTIEEAIERSCRQTGKTLVETAMLKTYIEQAGTWIREQPGAWATRELAKAKYWNTELTATIVTMLELLGLCTRADQNGLRRTLEPSAYAADRGEGLPPGTTVNVNGGPEYELGTPEAAAAIGRFASDAVTEKYYARAVEIVTTDRKASTSYIQRKLEIGYNLAASLMERMEREGVIGPANHVGKREIMGAAA